MSITNFHTTPDWKMFWLIENQDAVGLDQFCKELKNSNQDIGMYFRMRCWKDVFTETEAKTIKVYMCGQMDFSPVQHACDIDWIEGAKILFDHNIGCNVQGCGLGCIDKSLFNEFYNKKIQTI